MPEILHVHRPAPGYYRATIDNPPVNLDLLAQPHVQQRVDGFLADGLQHAGDFELNLADQLER